jgi:phosphinothricin acetyltransferase
MIRPVTIQDAIAICGIYNYYVKNTIVSFEETPVSIKEMQARIQETSAAFPWLVWEDEGDILGYAYAHAWQKRSAYRYSAEDSIYIKEGFERKGLGQKLFTAFLEAIRKTNLHVLVAGITIPNEPSVALHEKFGFKKTALFTEAGYKQERWLDVGYWELILK